MSSTSTPSAPSRRFTRDDIVRLGRAGKPWEFVPLVAQALRVAPDDAGLRALAAGNLAKLGLRTAATEHLEALPEPVSADPGVRELSRAVEALPDDRVHLEDLARTCAGNLAALEARGGPGPRGMYEAWKSEAAAWEWFRAAGGNIVRRRAGTRDAWAGFGDHAGAAERFVRQHFGEGATFHNVTIEGMDPPWLLRLVAGATARRADGSWTRLIVVQADPGEFLDGLAQADLREVIGQERVSFFVGADAGERLSRDLDGRLGTKLAGPVVPLLSVRRRVTPGLDQVIRGAEGRQVAEHERLTARVRARYAGRDRAWWRARYERAAAGDEPLRVLVPTCRYSTFIQHSSRDLVEALGRAGCRAELLIEPDDWSHFSSVAYLRKLAELEPDLVILINYTRSHLGGIFPPEVPFVCWLQDAMPHQFSVEAGRAQGPLDFLVGHLHAELFEQFAFPRERTLSMPVVASTSKFHAGPVDDDTARRYECEIAFLSHHSETPEAMHERLVREAGPDPATRQALDVLHTLVRTIAADPMGRSPAFRLAQATREALRQSLGREPAEKGVTLLVRQYAMPLADRLLRHEMLHWAADACERRGWRLRVYGRGWEKHPRFGAYAGGVVEHGEALRAAYRCAGVHLHASSNALVHQRVMECALSGGLPLCRLTTDALAIARGVAQRAAGAGEPAGGDATQGLVDYRVADCAEAMALTALLQRLGLEHGEFLRVGEARVKSLRSRPPVPPESRPDWVLVDLGETSFQSAADLEHLAARALESPAWRAGMSGAIAGRVRERLTHEVFVRRVLETVREGLA